MSRMKRQRFTLVELLVGMAVLTILMLMLFRLLISAQKSLELSDSVWKIYDNSRVVFDIFERDLQAAVTSNRPWKKIGIWVDDPDPTDQSKARHIVFVSSTEPPTAGGEIPTSRLCEVTYKHHTDLTTESPDIPPYTLTRQIVSDVDTDNWDFLGASGDWYKNTTTADGGKFDDEKIVAGVNLFTVECYDENDLENPNTLILQIPSRVVITMELFDESLVNAPEDVRNRTSRSFTKIFFLTHLESNN